MGNGIHVVEEYLATLLRHLDVEGHPSLFLFPAIGDITNHVGMKVETVSRMLTCLQAAMLIGVNRRQLEIGSVDALHQMSCG